MYQETVKYPMENRWANLLYLFGVIALIFGVSLLSMWLQSLGLKYMDFLAFGVLVALAAFVMYQRAFQYKYAIMGGDLLLYRVTKNGEKYLCSLGFDRIESLERAAKGGEKLPLLRCCVLTTRLACWQIVGQVEGKRRRILFQPSEKLVRMIRDRMAEAQG